MNRYLIEYREYSAEYLINLRARGDDLPDEAHEAIETVFSERKETIPPRPSRPIYNLPVTPRSTGFSRFLSGALGIVLILLTIGIGKALGKTTFGLVVSAAILLSWIILFFYKANLSDEERSELEEEKKAEDDGLNELMISSAKGDLERVRDLISFGFSVNQKSSIGTTALMYAAKNNHLEIVDLLLKSGADKTIKSDKGSTALVLAEQAKNDAVAALLRSAR